MAHIIKQIHCSHFPILNSQDTLLSKSNAYAKICNSFSVSLIPDLLSFKTITLIWSCLRHHSNRTWKSSCCNADGAYSVAVRWHLPDKIQHLVFDWLFKIPCFIIWPSKFDAECSKNHLNFWHNLHMQAFFLPGIVKRSSPTRLTFIMKVCTINSVLQYCQ